MNFILLGAPGSGKGTIAGRIEKHFGSIQISTGDILRTAIGKGTEIGKLAEQYMTRGDLVPDDVIMDIMKDRLREEDCSKGFILDGFPRTLVQAEKLGTLLREINKEINLIANLNVPESVLIQRLTSRRTCSNSDCHAIYNVITSPSKVEGICDKCGSKTIQRDDETETAIKHRIETYHEKTAPLVAYYKNDKCFVDLFEITVDDLFQELLSKLNT
jgi:adenylate kinase